MKTYPNQKIIHINKPKHTNTYLSIEVDEWIKASKNLKPITFKIYLYLASNADGFDLALSRQDVMDKLHISKNSYVNGIAELEAKGYIRFKQGNIYDFHTVSDETKVDKTNVLMYQSNGTSDIGIYQSNGTLCTNTVVHDVPIQEYTMYQSDGTEISKTSKTANLSKGLADAQTVATQPDRKKDSLKKKKRVLKDLSNEELDELLDDYTHEINYNITRDKFNLAKTELDKTLPTKIKAIKDERVKSEALEQIKDGLTEDITSELLELTGQKTKNDLINLLSEANAKPQEALWFLKKRDYFTHENWIKYEECYQSTYPFFFVNGFELNFDKEKYELDLEWEYC